MTSTNTDKPGPEPDMPLLFSPISSQTDGAKKDLEDGEVPESDEELAVVNILPKSSSSGLHRKIQPKITKKLESREPVTEFEKDLKKTRERVEARKRKNLFSSSSDEDNTKARTDDNIQLKKRLKKKKERKRIKDVISFSSDEPSDIEDNSVISSKMATGAIQSQKESAKSDLNVVDLNITPVNEEDLLGPDADWNSTGYDNIIDLSFDDNESGDLNITKNDNGSNLKVSQVANKEKRSLPEIRRVDSPNPESSRNGNENLRKSANKIQIQSSLNTNQYPESAVEEPKKSKKEISKYDEMYFKSLAKPDPRPIAKKGSKIPTPFSRSLAKKRIKLFKIPKNSSNQDGDEVVEDTEDGKHPSQNDKDDQEVDIENLDDDHEELEIFADENFSSDEEMVVGIPKVDFEKSNEAAPSTCKFDILLLFDIPIYAF